MPLPKNFDARIRGLDIVYGQNTADALLSLATILAESGFQPTPEYQKKAVIYKVIPSIFRNFTPFIKEIDTYIEKLQETGFKSSLEKEKEFLGIVSGTMAIKAMPPQLQLEYLANLP